MVDGEKTICLKPMTFMNLSGKSVLTVMQFYKIEAKDVLVLHDEIDFPFAKLQLKQGGSHA
jgi:peptidyl-tRNA hydrolase, PTH1 family